MYPSEGWWYRRAWALAFSSLSCIAKTMVRSSGSMDSGGCLNCCPKFMMRLERLDVPGIKRHGAWGLPSDVAEVTPFPTPGPQEQSSSTYLSRGISRLPADSNGDFYNPTQHCGQAFALIPPQAHCVYDAPTSRDKARSGGAWAIAIGAILSSSMVSDITASLRLTSSIIDTMPTSEFGQASVDFQEAVDETRGAWPDIFECSVEKLIGSIAEKFKLRPMSSLPAHVLQYVVSFLPLEENGLFCSISKDFRDAAEGDYLWRQAYYERFEAKRNTQARPSAAATEGGRDLDHRCGATGRAGYPAGDAAACGDCSARQAPQGFKSRFRRRLLDPQIDDSVEVAWRGKFRLESLEVYNGKAWWLAEIVDKKDGLYQVHYPGWEARWDEWVPRDRLRWGNERRANALQGIPATVGDYVEMWCEGVQVPGAWLEAVVQGVEAGKVNLGKMHTEGHFWVNESDVRLVRRGTSSRGCFGIERGDDGKGRTRLRTAFREDEATMASAQSPGHHAGQNSSGNHGCDVM